ncbi:hypothetical protein L202_00822 [Cryptococcus amylolentus CBS 6039]|uniref:Uncharacterized protein n=1 Tax=Cryptococcus amylolentus CBS 6039 TaxID=1295533 RepID=A0A1E3I8S6_9TREE|nr:hypothetical protein L202_00822 [Cryptococcus amylolentus CBS 6039]ODN84977.1 hypothetical protein L202_00822 [Cryptococcus amylolentus CBS 6039]
MSYTTDNAAPSADLANFEAAPQYDEKIEVDFEKEGTPTTDAIIHQTMMLRLATPEPAEDDDIQEIPARDSRPLTHAHALHYHHGPRGMPPPGFPPSPFDDMMPPHPPHHHMGPPPSHGFEHSNRGKPHGRPEHGKRGERPSHSFGLGARPERKHRHARAYSPPGFEEIKAGSGFEGRHHPRGFGRMGHASHGPRGHAPRFCMSRTDEEDDVSEAGSDSDLSITTLKHHKHHSFPHQAHPLGQEHGRGMPPHMRGMSGPPPPPPHMSFSHHMERQGGMPPPPPFGPNGDMMDRFESAGSPPHMRGMSGPLPPPPHISFDHHMEHQRGMPPPPPFGSHGDMMDRFESEADSNGIMERSFGHMEGIDYRHHHQSSSSRPHMDRNPFIRQHSFRHDIPQGHRQASFGMRGPASVTA